MNILVVSFCASHIIKNNAGNNNYIYHINKYFQKLGHKIYFLYIDSNIENYNLHAMKQEWEEVFVVKDNDLWKKSNSCTKVDFAYIENLGKLASNICVSRNIEMCICHYFVYSKILEVIPKNIIKVIDTHDIFTKRFQYLLKHLIPKGFINITTEKKEAMYLNRADIIIAKTTNDADFFNKITKSNKAIVIPHISYDKHINIDKKYQELKSIGFVGSNNMLNQISILKFLNAFDREHEKGSLQNIKIKIAGNVLKDGKYIYHHFLFKRRLKLFFSYISLSAFSNLFRRNIAKKFCKSIYKKPYIVHLGFVENLEDFYKDIDLIIIPTLMGTGINIKTAEAIERGVPILSTSNGSKGFNSNEKYHNINSMKDMVESIKEIKEKPLLLKDLAETSRRIYSEYIKVFNEGISKLFQK